MLNLAVMMLGAALAVQDPLKVVTTTTDLASIAREIGGDRVRVTAIAAGTQDPHFVEPKPSLILELRDADVFAQVGLGLESGWAPLLLDQSRNPRIAPRGAGHLDASAVATVLDIPNAPVSRAEGDIHPFGNPHYWLGPENGKRIAALFAQRFAALDPEGARVYAERLLDFVRRLDAATARWREDLAPHRGRKVIAYHNSWKYFLLFAGAEILDYVEPKPGVPPSATHLARLIERGRSADVRVVVVDPFYDARVPRLVAERTGAELLVLPSSVGGAPGVNDYIALLDHNVQRLVNALAD